MTVWTDILYFTLCIYNVYITYLFLSLLLDKQNLHSMPDEYEDNELGVAYQ